jgi:site-specific DNA-cytosine methylase
MRVLVACEASGTVRDAFRARGHAAWSVDVQPNDSGECDYHYRCDYREALRDLTDSGGQLDLVIGHPPCTALASSGNRWYADTDVRQSAVKDVLQMADEFNHHAKRWAIENPVGVLSSQWRKPDQIVQPYEYGDPARKRTCLWTHGLPPLEPTNVVEPKLVRYERQDGSGRCTTFSADYGVGYTTRHGKRRSVTYPGIAEAMAEQWTAL